MLAPSKLEGRKRELFTFVIPPPPNPSAVGHDAVPTTSYREEAVEARDSDLLRELLYDVVRNQEGRSDCLVRTLGQ